MKRASVSRHLPASHLILYALSVKQPWAALLVHGLKTIEIRKWPTERRGPILIHASRQPDDRPEAWKALPAEAEAAADLRGGIIGIAELTECLTYRTKTAFAADRKRHLNRPEWFSGDELYGFRFKNARSVPFQSVAGWVRFFPVDWNPKKGSRSIQLRLKALSERRA